MGRMGLKQNQAQTPCCVCWDLKKLPEQEQGLEVGGEEGSSVWGMKAPLEQRALEEVSEKQSQKYKVNLQHGSSDGCDEGLRNALWELTFNMSKGTEGPSGTAATLLHVITLRGFVDL